MSMSWRTSDFDYELPERLIASKPLENRAESRMLVVDRASGTIEHRMFRDFPSYLSADDLLVLNDTKVIHSRVFSDDGKCELVVVEEPAPRQWRCLVRPGKKFKVGRTVEVAGATGTVLEIDEDGNRIIEFDRQLDLEEVGSLALPHYMGRESEEIDESRYQTVYAREKGAIAAPTAGLHFTPEILSQLNHGFLTLHVGVGTFRPVKADNIEDHHMHSERYRLTAETAQRINDAKRTFAVGTTVTRVLETLGKTPGPLKEAAGETDIFIYPPFDFKVVDSLLTNFHLPQSTLMMLVSAMAGRDLIMEAYQQAVKEEYRFFSYGDCMLIL